MNVGVLILCAMVGGALLCLLLIACNIHWRVISTLDPVTLNPVTMHSPPAAKFAAFVNPDETVAVARELDQVYMV